MIIGLLQPYSTDLLTMVSKDTFTSPSIFVKEIIKDQKEEIRKAINKMVGANIFCYNSNGMITWHSKAEKSKFSQIQ